MRKLQNTKQSTKANTTIFALPDAKNHSNQTPKNISKVTHQVKIAAAVTTNAKPIKFGILPFFFLFLCFRILSKFLMSPLWDHEEGGR